MSYRLGIWFSSVLLLTLNVGCTQIRSPEKKVDSTTVEVEVAESKSPGVYEIAGSSSLPDNSQIRVAAIRYLHPDSQASKDLNPKPTYSILAYETTSVNQGKWKAQLNLWKVAADGRFQEAWQLDSSKLALPFKPDLQVVFLATLALNNRSEELNKIDQQIRKQGKMLENGVILTSLADNQRYIQASQTLEIDLPNGGTTPPGIKPEDVNGGWGNRYLMPPESPSDVKLETPKNRKTDAPPSRAEFLQ